MGDAVYVTAMPEQTGLLDAVIVMLTGRLGLTDTGYWILDAGLLEVQSSEEVRVQLTRSPFAGM